MSNKVTYSGNGLLTLLTILFVGLKLTHYIDWSWAAVLSPVWAPFVIFLFLFAFFAIVAALAKG